jgi:hypothetical protein
VYFADAHTGWAVGDFGTILATRDGGNSWEPQKSGTDKNLGSVHFADARTGCWARGGDNSFGAPIYPPLIEDAKVTAKGLAELGIAFRVKPDSSADVTAAQVWARVREAQWSPLGAAKKSDASDGGGRLWHLTWRPGDDRTFR